MKPPPNVAELQRRLRPFARDRDLTHDRAVRYVAYNAMFAVIARAHTEGVIPAYLLKGGVAIELRLGLRARASKDLDFGLVAPAKDLLPLVRAALALGWDNFTFAIKPGDKTTDAGTVRLNVQVLYKRKPWDTVKLDVTSADAETATDLLAPYGFEQIGMPLAPSVPCLGVLEQIAQKIHAVTDPRMRDRWRDIVDVVLYEPLIEGRWADLRTYCERVFARRATHAWPPSMDVTAEGLVAVAAIIDDLDTDLTVNQTFDRFFSIIARALAPEIRMKADYRYVIAAFNVNTGIMDPGPAQQIENLTTEGFRLAFAPIPNGNDGNPRMIFVFERLREDADLPDRDFPRLHGRLTMARNSDGRYTLTGSIRNLTSAIANRTRLLVSDVDTMVKLGMLAAGDEPLPVAIPIPAESSVITEQKGIRAAFLQYETDRGTRYQQTGVISGSGDSIVCLGFSAPVRIETYTKRYSGTED